MSWTDPEAQERAFVLEEALARVEGMADTEAQNIAFDAIQALTELYGEGLSRLVGYVSASVLAGNHAIVKALDADTLITHLLLVHDIDLHTRTDRPRDASNAAGPALIQLRRVRATRDLPLPATVPANEEQCGLCGVLVPADHRHLLDTTVRRLVCACRACALLFDHRDAGGRHYRLIPDRHQLITDFALTDELWAAIGIPVDIAFFFFDSAVGRVVAFYPGAMGVTESALPIAAWGDLVALNPVLEQMESDVEALLVNRMQGAREYHVAPVDMCYALAGVIRQQWRGFTGGEAVWRAIAQFFATRQHRATVVQRDGRMVSEPALAERIAS